jgi:predicted dehydrogenase
MSQPLRIGVIGAGGNTRAKHIPGLQAIPEVAVVAVCNRSRESAEKVAREFNIPTMADHWQQIVESPGIDAICIGTWPNFHAKLTVAALRAGKHVLTEARMARNLAEAELMLAEAKLHPKLVAQIVPAPMSLPFDATIIELLSSGKLGILREVGMTCTNGAVADPSSPLTWRQDFSLSGKNTMVLGIYYEMVLRWLQREPVSLVADAAVFTPERKDADGVPQPVQIPESLGVFATYDDGCRLTGHFSGVETCAPRNEIRLNGSKGSLRLDLAKGELWTAQNGVAGSERLVEIDPAKRGAWRVEADFVESIREGKPVRLTDFETGVNYMRFTEAVWESWSNGSVRLTL